MSTRSSAYEKSRHFAESQAGKIYEYISKNDNLTRHQISTNLMIRHSSCTARIRELINQNLVFVSGESVGSAGLLNETLTVSSSKAIKKSTKKMIKIAVEDVEFLILQIKKLEKKIEEFTGVSNAK